MSLTKALHLLGYRYAHVSLERELITEKIERRE